MNWQGVTELCPTVKKYLGTCVPIAALSFNLDMLHATYALTTDGRPSPVSPLIAEMFTALHCSAASDQSSYISYIQRTAYYWLHNQVKIKVPPLFET